ncbi:MAG: hypothetical protein ACTHMU_07535, partial [Thermomicrobiales bacterium]
MVGAEQRVQPASFEQAPGRRLYWLTVWRRWLALRFGPVAPHGVLLVALYATFALLARLISFGRVQRSTALVV